MSISHTVTVAWASTTGSPLTPAPVTLTGGTELNISVNVPGPSTNLLVPIAFAVSGLQSVIVLAPVAMTLKTNSSGSPQETITLAANVPFVWYAGCGAAVPFAGAVTAFYVTSAGSVAGNFNMRALIA